MPTALLTGPLNYTPDVEVALKSEGFEVLTAGAGARPVAGESGIVDCYVQLPHGFAGPSDDPLARARALVNQGVLARLEGVAQVAGLLASRGRVVLVADPDRGETPAPEMGLVHHLAHAVLAAHGRNQVRVAVVDGARTPADIARIARAAPPPWTAYPAIEPELGFADWRDEVMALSTAPDW